MQRRIWFLACLGAILTGGLASTLSAAAPSLSVSPAAVRAGGTVRLSGSADGCRAGSNAFLLSRAFVRRHEFAGVPAVLARVHPGGAFKVRTTIPRRWQPRVRRLAASEETGLMETAILTLLEQNESLGYEQIALYLGEPPEQVRSALTALRQRRFVDVLGISEVVGHTTAAVAYWRLTELGQAELARLRSR
jgi:hypothetical protein